MPHERRRKLSVIGKRAPLALLLLLFAAQARARAQGFDYDAYEPRTLAEMIKIYDKPEMLEGEMKDVNLMFGWTFPSRVKVVYAGTSRKTSEERMQYIAAWVRSRAMAPEIGELFGTELLFKEGAAEHWLPVQKQLIPHFERELKKGDAVMLYAIIPGGKKISGKWDWVILVNEFDKQ